MDDPFIYGLLIILFYFSLVLRHAFNSINKLQLELDKEKVDSHSRILNFISKNTTQFLISVNLGYFINLAIITLLINKLPLNASYAIIILAGLIISLILLLLFIITLGEYFANKVIRVSAIPLFIIYLLLYPFTRILISLFYKSNNSTNDINVEYNKINFDKNDLEKLVFENQEHTSNNTKIDSEIKFFQNALDLSEIKVRECMIPRTELIAIELNDIKEHLTQKFIETGHSKILIYKDSIDNIIGYINCKSLFSHNKDLAGSLKNLPIYPESMNASKLLKEFILTGKNMAVIVDEFGGTSGIVTTEDILEEIFGEIKDEHDSEDLYEKQLNDNSFVFSGRLEIDYVNEKYNLNFIENEDYETIAGLILYHTENIPKPNDSIKIGNFQFDILKVSSTRVELVKLEVFKEKT